MTSEERREARYQRRKAKRQERREARCAALGDISQVYSYRKMFFYGKRCCNGVRWKQSVQNFESHLFSGTARRRRQVLENTWKPQKCTHFTLCERGKVRPIDAPHITDRQIQKVHSNEVLIPLYEPSMIHDNGASRRGMGLHWQFQRVKDQLHWHYRRWGRQGGVLLMDLKSFFPNAPHRTIYQRHQEFILNPDLRRVADLIISSSPCPTPGRGMPLGVEPSQQEMVALPSAVDNWLKCQKGIHCAGHYMDDYYVFLPDLEELKKLAHELVRRFEALGIRVNKRKCKVIPFTKPFRFCQGPVHPGADRQGYGQRQPGRHQEGPAQAEAVLPGVQGRQAGLQRHRAVYGVPERILSEFQRPRAAAPSTAAVPCHLFWRCTMYKLSRNGESLGMTEALTYIKTAANGCYVLCPEPRASGHCLCRGCLSPSGAAGAGGHGYRGRGGGGRRDRA